MQAFKFLRPGAVAPFSGVRWPAPEGDAPGAWVRAERDGRTLCRTAVHACARDHLPYWLCEELWIVELADPVAERGCKLVAPAGRLLERVGRWDAAAATAFAGATVERIRAIDSLGYMTEADAFCRGEALRTDPFAAAAVSTLIAVEAAEHAGGHEAVRRERAAQAAWLAEHLALAAAPV